MVIIVLLNVAFTWATPDVMFLRSRRRTRVVSSAIVVPYPARLSKPRALPLFGPGYFSLPAIGLAGSSRPAHGRPRWPRT